MATDEPQTVPVVSIGFFYSSTIQTREDDNFDQTDSMMALQILFTIKQNQTMNLSIRNVTKIQFGTCLDQIIADTDTSIRRNKISIQVLAHLISMTVQLKYLVVQHFKWLLYAAQYASEELGANTLSTVRYVEFSLPSCHNSSQREILMCKQLVPFLKQYMPYLQTLHIWRPDDFPWTSSRHATVFKQDLCQLVKNLKELTFLDIHGEIDHEKVESYRLMAQRRFPNSRIDFDLSRFRLWL
ncbi:unnamed protein product [Rotaria magnacalcarata]|uniref:Uncharacterized protein n=1 Tax=Rotaria magnacalcarata TaxID=392030 RepID=A0A815KZL6_9BILA|nr:unnamed protein product [Rotaria magnacalcarata]